MRAEGGTPARGIRHQSTRLRIRLLAACALLGTAAGQTEEAVTSNQQDDACMPEQSLHWRGGTLRLENDLFAGTDRNYTNGVTLALVSHDINGRLRSECMPWLLGLYTRSLDRIDRRFARRATDESASQNIVLRAGQTMYTPEDKTRSDLIPDDRPFAGLLYLGLAWNRRMHPEDARYETLDSRELTLGVIGPWSLAEHSQNLVHRTRGLDRFRGWDHQLRNEPAFQVALERKYKAWADGAIRPGWGSDVIGSYTLRVGNIETAAGAGVELRAGWNIPNDFGSYPIRPGAENRPPSAAANLRHAQPGSAGAPRAGTHAFINLEARAIAWDFSLDGNLFRSSHHVSRRPWVAQAAAGLSSQWLVGGHGLRLALMRVWRTREFDEQPGHHAFGSVALSVEL
jgi:hypothetical protein